MSDIQKSESGFVRSMNAPPIGLFDRLLKHGFACNEVVQIRQAIDLFFLHHEFPFCESSVRTAARKLAADSSRAKHSIRVEGKDPKQIALILIGNVAMSMLTNGNFHVYRGVLNTVGKEALSLFKAVRHDAVVLGFETSDEAKQELIELRREISEVG